uniref:THAP-type domain-containing protein n=1 Tax=Acanthochromis polyacanthus TaxID=80966 RepID=A0A3Q1FYB5_9TELE
MKAHCAAFNCTLRRMIDTRKVGITFHRFPKDNGLNRKWEVALRREGFAASVESVLCSKHFKPDEFERAGEICRLRPGAIPSLFNFLAHLRRSRCKLWRVYTPLSVMVLAVGSMNDYKIGARVLSLEKKKRNAQVREKRAKTTIKALLKWCCVENSMNWKL